MSIFKRLRRPICISTFIDVNVAWVQGFGPPPPNIWPAGMHQCVGPPRNHAYDALFTSKFRGYSVVVEQVYSSTFKFWLLKNTRKSIPWNVSFLPLNASKCVWWPDFARTRWGYSVPPDPLAGLKAGSERGEEWEGEGTGARGKRERGEGEEGKGRTPHGLKNVLTC